MGIHLSARSESFPMNIPTRQGLDGFQKSSRLCALDERSISIGRVSTDHTMTENDDIHSFIFYESLYTERLDEYPRVLCANENIHTVQTFNSYTSRPDVWLYKYPWVTCYKPQTLMTHVACETKLLSVVRSSIHS